MTRLACIIVLSFCLGLAACGDDDDSGGGGDSGGGAPSKQEFAKNAEQICRNAEKELEQIGEGASSPEDLSAALGKALDRSRDAADELADLERPEGADGETATKFVEGFKQEFEDKLAPAIEDLRDAVEQTDQQAVQDAASKLESLENTESDKYARDRRRRLRQRVAGSRRAGAPINHRGARSADEEPVVVTAEERLAALT